MGIVVDARLQQSSPVIYLRSDSGKILMHWTAATVQQWLDSGDISSQDLLSPGYSWLDLLAATR